MNLHDTVSVTGIWLRRIGDDIQVLAEIDGAWRIVIVELHDGQFSHIAEPRWMLKCPLDTVS